MSPNNLGLSAQLLAYYHTQQPLFDNFSLEVKPGELVQIVGGNGVGKSTLLRILVGLLPPKKGDVFWNGIKTTANSTLLQRELFYLDHAIAIKPSLTTLENLMYDIHLLGLSPQQALSALSFFGLGRKQHTFAYQLSRGQQQRLALAKLLCSKATLFILDEPLTALDDKSVALVQEILQQKQQQKAAIILTSHRPLAVFGRIKQLETV